MNIMIKVFKIIVMGISVLMLSSCAENSVKKEDKSADNPVCKQELSKSVDWVASWDTCSGDGAIKEDGTLWQFGKVGGCDWGQMLPLDPNTGKPVYKTSYVYHLEPKKIGDGFDGAKIINGGYRDYAIKKDGTLWGWGEGFRKKPILLSHSYGWVDFGVKWAGNGCCSHDVGLQKDGSLWRFPEGLNYAKKSPIPDLRRVGKQKRWDKVILHCCTIYAMKKDGTLWVNRATDYKTEFVKFDHKVDCAIGGESFCKKLKSLFSHMTSQTIYNYEEQSSSKINVGTRAGTLCISPKMVVTF